MTYPTPTNGVGVPAFMELTGTGVTNANPQTGSGSLVGGNNTYKVTLSLSGTAGLSTSVIVTASLFDLAGSQQSAVASVTALSYNALPTTFSGTIESYPTPKATVGEVATVATPTSTGAPIAWQAKITPENEGQAVIEFEYPAFASTNASENVISSSLPMQNDKVYSQILVNVVA